MTVDHILDRPDFPTHWQCGIERLLRRLTDAELGDLIQQLAFKRHPSWLPLKRGIIQLLDHHWKRVHAIYHQLCVSKLLTGFRLRYAFTPNGSILVQLRCRFGRRLAESRPIQSPQFDTSRDRALLSLMAAIMGCAAHPLRKLRATDEQRCCFINRCIAFFGKDQPARFLRPGFYRARKRRFELQLLLDAVSSSPPLTASIPSYFLQWLRETRQCGQSDSLRLSFVPEGRDDLADVLYETIYPYLLQGTRNQLAVAGAAA